ncbi:MAG: MOSC domain-containing protein [Gammaproteobacteria bacterium]
MNAFVVSIHAAAVSGSDMFELAEAELVPGRGIVSDRHFDRPNMAPEDELTLIESEQMEEFNSASGLQLAPAEARRNVVTRGIRLNEMVGREFQLGGVRLRGIELCEPCSHLAALLARQDRLAELTTTDFLRLMAHRAGLRAQILNAGFLRPGDPVVAD